MGQLQKAVESLSALRESNNQSGRYLSTPVCPQSTAVHPQSTPVHSSSSVPGVSAVEATSSNVDTKKFKHRSTRKCNDSQTRSSHKISG